jgi:hypothetical protein
MTVRSKSIVKARTVRDADGDLDITEKIVAFWSEECRENMAGDLEMPETWRKSRADPWGAPAADSDEPAPFSRRLGHNIIRASEIRLDDAAPSHKCLDRPKIKDAFKISDSDLDGGPARAGTPGHANAHFLICFRALRTLGIIRYKISRHLGEAPKTDAREAGLSETGLSEARTRRAPGDWSRFVLNKGAIFDKNDANDPRLLKTVLGANFSFQEFDGKSVRETRRRVGENGLTKPELAPPPPKKPRGRIPRRTP